MHVLYMPLLHPDTVLACAQESVIPSIDAAYYLWPGLPHMPKNFWQPHAYPFSPAKAKACLDDYQAMSALALTGVPVQALVQDAASPKARAHKVEHDAIQQFMATGNAVTNPNDTHYAFETAQKFLLWAWLLEERAREVHSLMSDYSKGVNALSDVLAVEGEEHLAGLDALEKNLFAHDTPLPPWQRVLEHAAVFLPDGCRCIINHPEMIDHIKETCPLVFLEDQTKTALNGAKGRECVTTPAALLQKDACICNTHPWLEKTFHFIVLEQV